MPYTRHWLLEERVIFLQFDEEITLDDISSVTETHEKWLRFSETTNMIHYILDLRLVKIYPRNILQIKESLRTKMARTDWVLFVTDDFFLSHLGDVFGKLFNYRFKQCASVRDAYRLLQNNDEIPIPDNWSDNLDDTMPLR
ncbi:MAG: hypothetical protein Phog2KO_28000 [Phototrophicaceae bacterium]